MRALHCNPSKISKIVFYSQNIPIQSYQGFSNIFVQRSLARASTSIDREFVLEVTFGGNWANSPAPILTTGDSTICVLKAYIGGLILVAGIEDWRFLRLRKNSTWATLLTFITGQRGTFTNSCICSITFWYL